LRGFRRRGPTIVGDSIGELVAGERAELAQVRREHQRPVGLSVVKREGVGVEHRRDGAPAQRGGEKPRAHGLATHPRSDDERVGPFQRLRDRRLDVGP